MYKLFEFGAVLEQTGERRVTLLDAELVKTAESAIREHWATLSPNPDKAYLHVIACTAHGWYPPNRNGDAWTEETLKATYKSFEQTGTVFMHHMNRDPKTQGIGTVVFAFYNERMHRIELIIAIDKKDPKAAAWVEKIKRGEDLAVSIGCRVPTDRCSICGNRAKTRAEYCDHLKYNMKKILPDGRQVFAYNDAPLKWFDISLVSRPAEPTAFALDKVAAAQVLDDAPAPSSAELGERAEDLREKLAGLKKLSDIIKAVDGEVVDVKDAGLANLAGLKTMDLGKLDYPSLDLGALDAAKASPGAVVRAVVLSGAPLSLGEAAWASGRHFLGDEFQAGMIPALLRALPQILPLMQHNPGPLFAPAAAILGDYRGELEDPGRRAVVLKIVAPVARERIVLIKQACDMAALTKTAGEAMAAVRGVAAGLEPVYAYDSPTLRLLHSNYVRDLTQRGPGMLERLHVLDDQGRMLATDRKAAQTAQVAGDISRGSLSLVGALLGIAALGAIMAEPTLTAKLLHALPLAAAAAPLLHTKDQPRLKTLEGVEVPAHAPFYEATSELTKQGAVSDVAPLLGLSVPLGLGLDYAINRYHRYRDYPYYQDELPLGRRLADKAGQKVVEHPGLSTAAGLIGGAAAPRLYEKLLHKVL